MVVQQQASNVDEKGRWASIDADAHVIETERTWDFMDASDRRYRPILAQDKSNPGRDYWIIDGEVRAAARTT